MNAVKKASNALAFLISHALFAMGVLMIYVVITDDGISTGSIFAGFYMSFLAFVYPATLIETFRKKKSKVYQCLIRMHPISRVLLIAGIWLELLICVPGSSDSKEMATGCLVLAVFMMVPMLIIESARKNIRKEKNEISAQMKKKLRKEECVYKRRAERMALELNAERAKYRQAEEEKMSKLIAEEERKRRELEEMYSAEILREKQARVYAEENVCRIRSEEEEKRKRLVEEYNQKIQEEKNLRWCEIQRSAMIRKEENEKRERLEAEYRSQMNALRGKEYDEYIKRENEERQYREKRRQLYKRKFNVDVRDVSSIDGMEGHLFEEFCAELLKDNGFEHIHITPPSGDQGVDVLAEIGGVKYAIQCKNYASHLSNTPIQEVNAGKLHYKCHLGAVMTNSDFSKSAVELAKSTGVILWDRSILEKMLDVLK